MAKQYKVKINEPYVAHISTGKLRVLVPSISKYCIVEEGTEKVVLFVPDHLENNEKFASKICKLLNNN